MPFIKVKDINIYYELKGTGPRLLYINGTGGDLRKKPNVFDLPVAQHFTVLAYDQRGLGQTCKPNSTYTTRGYADDAVALLETVGWEKANVYGVSFGGMVAQELAINHPEKLLRLALACTSPGGAGGSSYPLHKLAGLSVEEKAQKVASLTDIRIDNEWIKSKPNQYQSILEKIKSDWRIGLKEAGRQQGAKLQLKARKHHDAFDRLKHIKHPTFIAGGEYDGICNKQSLSSIHQQIDNSQLKFYNDGHLFFMQQQQYWSDLIDFFKEG